MFFGSASGHVIQAANFFMQVSGSNAMKADADFAQIIQTLLTNLQNNWMNNKAIESTWPTGQWTDQNDQDALASALKYLDPKNGPVLVGLLACADLLLMIAKSSADDKAKPNYIQTAGVVSSTANADEQMGTSTLNTAGQVANQVPGQDQQFLQTAQDLANAILQGILSALSGIISAL